MAQQDAAMTDAEIEAQLEALKRAHEDDSAGAQNALDRGILTVGTAFSFLFAIATVISIYEIILFAMNMQVSYLSPPFGPAAFYLKSVAPKDMSLSEIFRALIPFICIQVVALAIVLFFPQVALWLPEWLKGN
ncbi:TRAP-type mannitol/chloroaromatic compound transport system, large permease component (plasmid) [Marinovum algicola DG 898]|nr:TRAP-type mannitol/chloroaromatic compound transport system, large permease component [Marinovum algicola DG 898]